jgi:hypothetical protein
LKHQIVVLSGEAADTNFLVNDLTQSAFEPTIHCTRGEHANHYTTNAVQGAVKQHYYDCKCRTVINALFAHFSNLIFSVTIVNFTADQNNYHIR